MKNYILTAAIAMVTFGLFTAPLLVAGEQKLGEGQFKCCKQGGAGVRRGMGPGGISRLIKSLGLDPEKEKTVLGLFKEQQQGAKQWLEANKEQLQSLRGKLREARKANDKDAMKKVRGEIATMHEARLEKLMAKLSGELNEEQVTKVRKFFAKRLRPGTRRGGRRWDRRRFDPFAKLDLTDEQKAKIKAIREETRSKINDVLTPEQREKLKKLHRQGRRKMWKRGHQRWKDSDTKPADTE